MLINPQRFDKACEILAQADVIAIDTETYWVKNWDDRRMIGLSVYCKWGEKYFNGYFPFRHAHDRALFPDYDNLSDRDFKELSEAINRPDCTHLYHNAKFDINILRHEGLHIISPFYCTMIMAHMIDENTDKSLASLCKMLKIDPNAKDTQEALKDVGKQLGGWHCIPPEVIEYYACGDTRLTYKLWKKLLPALKAQELNWEAEEEFCRVLANMEFNGIGLDTKKSEELVKEAETRMAEIEVELGFDPMKPYPLYCKLQEIGFKWKYDEVGAKTKQFPEGRPSMAEPILEKFKHPVVDLVLEYRGLVKAKSTWYIGMVDFCDPAGRVHPNFKQHGTETTRLSCSKPNMHQLPRNIDATPVKRLLRARPGYQLWEFDYSQIEYRLAAVYAGEESIINAYKIGSDFHELTATKLGIPRQHGKTINFAILYGGRQKRIADLLGLTEAEGKEILDAYNAAYPKLEKVRDHAHVSASQKMYIKMWNGRRRHFKIHWECKDAFNSLIQGGAAQIMHRAVCEVERQVDGWGNKWTSSTLVNIVHDAAWYELDEQSYAYDLYRIKHGLEWPSRDTDFKIPFPVEMKRLA